MRYVEVSPEEARRLLDGVAGVAAIVERSARTLGKAAASDGAVTVRHAARRLMKVGGVPSAEDFQDLLDALGVAVNAALGEGRPLAKRRTTSGPERHAEFVTKVVAAVVHDGLVDRLRRLPTDRELSDELGKVTGIQQG